MSSYDDLYRAILEHNLYSEEEQSTKDSSGSSKRAHADEDKLSRYDVVSAVTVALALALLAIRIYILVSS